MRNFADESACPLCLACWECLAAERQQEVGMRSIVIVANSAAKLLDGWLVTSRGYSI